MDIRDRALRSICSGVNVVFRSGCKNCITDCLGTQSKRPISTLPAVRTYFKLRRDGRWEGGLRRVFRAVRGQHRAANARVRRGAGEFYALGKRAERVFALGFKQTYGLPMTALRCFCVYGPRQDYRRTIPPVMSAFIIKLLRGETPIIYGTGEKRRDFIHVDDVKLSVV